MHQSDFHRMRSVADAPTLRIVPAKRGLLSSMSLTGAENCSPSSYWSPLMIATFCAHLPSARSFELSAVKKEPSTWGWNGRRKAS